MKSLLTIFALLLLVGCSNQADNNNANTPPLTEENKAEQPVFEDGVKEEETSKIDFKQYFKPTNSTATFLGEGNEFASYTEKTKWLSDQYVATIINNGGAVTMKVYRILDDQVEKVYDELVEGMPDEAVYPEVSTLDNAEVIDTYLKGPIEVGTTFGNWKIVETGVTVETPYQTFNNAFVIEETGKDYVNRKYFVKDFGEIKSESIMQINGNEEFIVTSTLEKLETP